MLRFSLERKISTILLIGTFILSSCGQKEDIKIDNNNPIANIKAAETEDKFQYGEYNESSEDLPGTFDIPINTHAENIHYYSKDNIDLLRAQHRCESDGKNIYLVHGEPDLYIMPIGTDEHYPANIDNPEKLNVLNITFDTGGRIHLLLATPDNREWFIWQLGENYQVDKTIDISAYFETEQMPLWFLIDKDGTYYLQWLINRDGIIIDSEGMLKHRFSPESLETKWIYEAAVGKDGQIYLVHGEQDVKLTIGKFDMKNCLIENGDPVLFPGNEIFSEMSGGTDSNLLLFSPYSGVWACGTEKGILENRVPFSELGTGFDSEFWPLTFLPDGRLILLGTAQKNTDDSETPNHLLIKYIPVTK